MKNDMGTHDYFIVTPFDVYRDDEFTNEVKERLASEGHKVIGVVFDCKDYKEFERKYFKW